MNSREEIDQICTLFKYVTDSPEVIEGLFVNNRIRFTQPAALNDPLEFNPAISFDSDDGNFCKYEYRGITMPSIHDWYRLNLIESRINNYGILSLTDNPFSFEMWCHYANGHKGILIEFNTQNKLKPELELTEGNVYRAHRVRYVKNYAVNIDVLERNHKGIPFHRIRDAIFLRKTNHWKYEREYRIVRPLSDSNDFRPTKRRTSYRDVNIYLFPFSLTCISSIIFGVNTPRDVKHKIIELCQGSNISFLQTVIMKDQQNRIDFVSIDSFGSTGRFLEMLPQLFTADAHEIKYKDKILVNDLKDIPYYDLSPKDYDAYYLKQVAKLP
jgi:hypothetical protein